MNVDRFVVIGTLLLLGACSTSAQVEREALVGTWQLVVDGDTAGACDMAVSAIEGGIEGLATCDVSKTTLNVGPDCDRVERKSEIYGKLLDTSFEARVDVVTKFAGSGCAALGIDTTEELRLTEASAEAKRTSSGSGAFNGSWSIDTYSWECTNRVGALSTCIETARSASETACDLTVRDVSSGDFDTTCRRTQGGSCEGKLAFSGSANDSKIDLTLSLTDCDGNNPETSTFSAAKLQR
ncbi:MAG: hypothetical protein KC503_45645 [Myxococcales bacterium]|nr:hypothetical protein [Myxococcales bacterium]